jgi:hypothetical protein
LPLDPDDPLEPLEPDEPLDPDDPLEPLDPDEPLVPDEPLDPTAPLAPELPLLPEDPLLPAGSVGNSEAPGELNSSLEFAPLQATSEASEASEASETERMPVERTIAAARAFMTAELYRPEQRCPTPSAHDGDSFPSLSAGLAGS